MAYGVELDGGRKIALRDGISAGLPFVLVVAPFALIFGVVAREAGLDLLQTMAMSILVIAGASQFTALTLLQDQAPVLITVLAALAVNLRMAMYSAALTPHLGHAGLGTRALVAYLMVDQSYAMSAQTYERRPEMPLGQKLAYYFGIMVVIAPLWYVGTLIGALAGRTLPPALSLDFAVPVCFIAMLAPLLRSLPSVVAALVSCVGAIVFAWVPWSLGLVVAACFAMVAGVQTERWVAHRT